MAKSALKPSVLIRPLTDPKTSIKKVKETYTEEIIIGLCGHIGTNIHLIAEWIEDIFSKEYKYECHKLTLSNFIRDFKPDIVNIVNTGVTMEFNRVFQTIQAGNKLREESGDNSILTMFAILEIAKRRNREQKKDGLFEPQKVCYIIDSIKHKEELELLRVIYRDVIYFIGVFSPIDVRIDNLINRNIAKHEITNLMNIDSGEEISHGQKVTVTFTDADYFLRIDFNNKQITDKNLCKVAKGKIYFQLSRFFNLILGIGITTPTKDETAMFLAASASKNSACLNRQVGAAITDKNGDVIAVGWNDVPQVGGNLYQGKGDDKSQDFRCMNFENRECINNSTKKELIRDVANKLQEQKIISEIGYKNTLKTLSKTRLNNLTEYCRAVHAEMHALIIGSQNTGKKMAEGRLFCTTYPCHNCAKHIILAGIKQIYYIEPYRKSLCTSLHSDSITEDEKELNKVVILMYNGVSPRRYMEFFTMIENKRIDKETGKAISLDDNYVEPKRTLSLEAIPTLESIIVDILKEKGFINE
jgi:deoxycytidylate deaminase